MLAQVERAATPNAQTSLWIAAVTGDTAAIAAAVRAGAKVDSLDPQGNRRALNYAALGNHVAAVRVLLAHGSDGEPAEQDGLHAAASRGGGGRARRTCRPSSLPAPMPAIASAQGALPIDTARRRGRSGRHQIAGIGDQKAMTV